MTWLWVLAACGGGDVYIVEGVVVEVHPPDEVVLDHEPIAGLMDAMVMPFEVADAAMLNGLAPGDRVTARYRRDGSRGELVKLRVTGHGPPPAAATGPVPLRVGQTLPSIDIAVADGSTIRLGPEQTDRVALTFLYTRCPRPDFCPALLTRLQALEQALGDTPDVTLVAVTIDPEHDTLPVLAAYAASSNTHVSFGRAPDGDLDALAMRAGLPVLRSETDEIDIQHGLRLLVFDRGGVLLERYDDARFPVDRVVEQLKTGAPRGDPTQSGTSSP